MSGKSVKTIVAVPPEFLRGTAPQLPDGFSAAYMIYRVGRGFKLFRSKHAKGQGGYMVLDISGFRGGGPISALVSEVLSECESSSFGGIVIDTGTTGAPGHFSALSKALASAAHTRGLSYFVPETLADSGANSIVRVQTALSGGTLKRYLSEFVKKYGANRVAAEIERIRMDFTLPSRSGVGKELTSGELDTLMARHCRKPHFSTELAVNYFHYRDKKNAHFVLYDDESTIRRKLTLAEGMEIKYAFLFYPNVRDILKQ